MSENIYTVMVQRGNFKLGMWQIKADGTKEGEPYKWIPDPNGRAVIVCPFDPESNKPKGEAQIYPIWDSIGVSEDIREKLGINERNFPPLEEWYRWFKSSEWTNADMCEVCKEFNVDDVYDCDICPLQAIKNKDREGDDSEDN